MPAGSSKHLPVAGLTSCPLTARHCWFAPPLQGHHSRRVPLAELLPVISRQPPSIVMVPLVLMVQLCAAAKPLQSNICTLLPGVAAALLLSRHLAPLTPDTIGPVRLPPATWPYPAATMLA